MLCTELEVFKAFCDKAGTPLAYKSWLLAARGEWGRLTTQVVDPRTYTCPETLQIDLQVVAFFKKHPGLPLDVDRRQAAVDGFWEAERQCFGSNRRLFPLLDNIEHYGTKIGSVIRLWKDKISKVLGRAPTMESLTDSLKFGPGATFSNNGEFATIAHKLSDGFTRTEPMSSVLPFWRETCWGSYAARGISERVVVVFDDIVRASYELLDDHAERDFTVVRGNRFTTVPKDAYKDRGIAVEASLNVAYQLALGTAMSKRMKRVLGWDKRTCQAFHKDLARIGSLTGAISTIDLSMASDTVCSVLVELLLPPDWHRLLTMCRSTHTRLDGKWVRLEKFSSMGNGFTFELETLLFFTLAQVMCEVGGIREDAFTPGLTTSVFGDDIIVPSSCAEALVSALRFFGFRPNESKTFLKGKFRESCGGDYFSGRDVRPHYQKEEVTDVRSTISLANGIRRSGARFGSNLGPLWRAWTKALDAVPADIRRIRGPVELGDLVLHDDHWARHNPMRVRSGIRYLRTWRPVPVRAISWEQFRPGVQLATALWNARESIQDLPCDLTVRQIRSFGEKDARSYRVRFPGILPGADRLKVVSGETMGNGVRAKINGSFVSGYKKGYVAWS